MCELSDVCIRGRTVCMRNVLTCILITTCFAASWLNTAAAQKTEYYTRYSRRDRDVPWWFHEKPFQAPATTTSHHKPPSVDNNHNHPNRPDRPWWWDENSPFNVATNTRQPTEPPPPPPVEETPTPTRRSTRRPDRPWWLGENSPFSAAANIPQPAEPPPPPPVEDTPAPTRRPPPPPRRVVFPDEGLSVSERKCKEYAGRVTTQVSALPLVPEPEPVHVNIPKCNFSSVPLIVGGEETKLKEFPHMAALGYEEEGQIEWRCGGSLISEYYVLTAAHCVRKNHEPTYARLGDLNLKRSDDGAEPVNYLVDRVIRHPLYKPPAKYNDIALLRLDRKVQFSDFIRPACLYTKETFDVNKTVATGWGKIEYAEKQSDVLLKVVITIIDNNLCNELYEMGNTRDLKNGIVDSMMCAGELKGGKDTCQGDSGGPIQITRQGNQCIFSIIGVTSFGKFCAAQNAPGVYTRVSSFVPWIESVVWPNDE
ncbi:serine protease snake-like isoform X2 [Periplaneta americana]|uniref:serine protease snake-like isoform X2 n=1 Tax=Periplaneta americana TaxID=6978 RepID=UPI0037E980D7